jgi:hypothetical protein
MAVLAWFWAEIGGRKARTCTTMHTRAAISARFIAPTARLPPSHATDGSIFAACMHATVSFHPKGRERQTRPQSLLLM